MTHVQMKRTGGMTEIRITGHSGYSQGLDVVCTACSTLAYTLLQCLLDAQVQGDVTDLRHAEQSASMYIRFDTKGGRSESAEAIMNTVMTGFRMLEDQYPDYVKVDMKMCD